MTEADWLVATDPTPMLEFLRGKVSDRKLRLFAVSCARAWWHLLEYNHSRQAVELAERHADGELDDTTLWDIEENAWDAWEQAHFACHPTHNGREFVAQIAAYTASKCELLHGQLLELWRGYNSLQSTFSAHCGTLRDIFGNPFRPVAFAPRWLSETAVALATGIYADRAFDRMPILADALEEAGCNDANILTHCRGPGPHVRGCWVVDRVLGKE